MKIFFATDIHGSEVCWRKFLNSAAFYKADMVVLGGDVTGKVMVPIIDYGGRWKVTVRGQEYTLAWIFHRGDGIRSLITVPGF
jgi:uncharacterized protein